MTHIPGIFRDHKPAAESESWPAHKVQRLIALAKAGKNGHEIAADLGLSRPACLGKARHLGLSIRRPEAKSPRKRRAPKLVVDNTASKPLKLRRVAMPHVDPLPTRMLPLGEVKPNECRYPTSDGRPHLFCGHNVEEGRVYCPGHCAIAFDKSTVAVEEKAA